MAAQQEPRPTEPRRDDTLRLSIRLPEAGREFVVMVFVFAAVVTGVGAARLFFGAIDSRPFGGYLIDHFFAVAPATAGLITSAYMTVRWVWSSHKRFIRDTYHAETEELKGLLTNALEKLETLEALKNELAAVKGEQENMGAYLRGFAREPYEPRGKS